MKKIIVTCLAILFATTAHAQWSGTRVDTIYADGQKVIVKSNIKDGFLHGKRFFYTNTRMILAQEFKNGLLNGLEVWYDESGNKEAEIPFKDGKTHGVKITYNPTQRTYYLNGQLVDKTTFLANWR